MRKKFFRRTAAFTLYELVIVMALSLLVVGLVTSYIIFANRFNARNEAAYQRAEQFSRLREEIDTWFSFADSSNYDIILNDSDSNSLLLVYLKAKGGDGPACDEEEGSYYGISVDRSEGFSVTFRYPEIEGASRTTVTVSCSYISDIKFYEYGEGADNGASADAEGESVLRFTLETTIQQGVYACEFFA